MGRMKAAVKGRAARKAARTSRSAAKAAVQLKASELYERVRDADSVERVQAFSGDLAGRSAELADRARSAARSARADVEELADRTRGAAREARTEAEGRASELADRTRAAKRAAERSAEERVSDVQERVSDVEDRASDVAGQGRVKVRRAKTAVPVRVQLQGGGGKAKKVRKAEKRAEKRARRRRGLPGWLVLVLGTVAGFAAAAFVSRRRREQQSEDLFVESAEWTAAPPTGPAPSAVPSVDTSGLDVEMPTVTGPLDEEIRTRMDADPRTTGLSGLAINVAESTVFVRGSVPEGFDPAAIREVVAAVPGVTDVDLQVTTI